MDKRLVFKPFSLVKTHIAHAMAADKHAPSPAQREDEKTPGPALILSRDQSGIYLMSNGRPIDIFPVYPQGLYPPVNPRWQDKADSMFGKIYFDEALPLEDAGEHLMEAPDHAELVIDVGENEITATILV